MTSLKTNKGIPYYSQDDPVEFKSDREELVKKLDELFEEGGGGGFTPTEEQLAAINSGATEAKIQQIEKNKTKIDNIPIMYEKINTTDPLQGDKCIFNFYKNDDDPFTRMVQKLIFNAYIPEVIAGGSIWGTIETTEMVKSNNVLYIEQVFTAWMGSNTNNIKKFKRTGISVSITDPYTQITSDSSGILFNNWYPIEYPSTSVAVNTGVSGTGITYSVTGGILNLIINNIKTTNTGSTVEIATLPTSLPFKQTSSQQWACMMNWTDKTSQLVCVNSLTKKILFYAYTNASKEIYGQMLIPLGY